MKITRLFFLLFLIATASAQTPDNDALFGTPGFCDDSARIRFATNSQLEWSLSALTFDWHNGPLDAIDYQDHTFGFGFNVNRNGTKIDPKEVSFSFSNESKYRNGISGGPGSFMSEHYFSWCSPYDVICTRPVGWTVQYDTGNVRYDYHGDFYFFRHASNGGAQWGALYDNGMFDMSMADGGVIVFKNNTPGLLWRGNPNNSVAPIWVDAQNQVRVGGGQVNTLITSQYLTYNVAIKRGDKQILGAQCAAIDDPLPSEKLSNVTVVAVLNCLRQHGLLAQ